MSVLSIPTESTGSVSASGAWSDPAAAALELAPSGLSGPDGVMLPVPEPVATPQTGRTQVVLCDGAADTVLPALWLRARSADPTQRDTVTGQRLMNPHLLPDDLCLTDARLEGTGLCLAFSDGFSGRFDPQELLAGSVLDEACPAPLPWQSDMAPQPVYQWDALQDDAVLVRALKE